MTPTLHFSQDLPLPTRTGAFVVFEGGDGSGKSTQARILADRLASLAPSHEVLLTREPGGTVIGEKLRALVLDHDQGDIDPHTEALIYAASRSAHAHQKISPALQRGAVVVCDRYIDSSVAYQGAGRELGEETIEHLSRWATNNLIPDITVLISLDLGTSRTRARRRGLGEDRLESESDTFHSRVHDSFARMAQDEAGGRVIVDGNGTLDEVAAQVWEAVLPHLPETFRVAAPQNGGDNA